MFDRFTDRARKIMGFSRQAAQASFPEAYRARIDGKDIAEVAAALSDAQRRARPEED